MSPVPTPLPLVISLLAGGLLQGCGTAEEPPRQGPRPPHLLLVTIDTLRADHLGFYGYERPTSPALDALAAQSIVFDAAQASSSWTLPGLASALTSHYTSTHRCWGFSSRLDDSFTTLTELLLASGYDTACITSHVFTTTRHGLQQGFVHFDDSFAYPAEAPESAVTSEVISDGGIRFLEEKAAARDALGEAEPWMLWLHYFDPHDDYVVHEGITEQFLPAGTTDDDELARARYDGEIRFTDGHVGRVLAALEEQGFADDTIVVLLSDHGEEFRDHGGRGHAHTLFAELVRVPFVIRAPGFAPGRVAGVVRTVDLMPTVLELLGLPAFPDVAGTSLVPEMRGTGSAKERPALVELNLWGTQPMESVVRGRWKYVRLWVSKDANEERLFDLVEDPDEQVDVKAEHPELVAELAGTLTRLTSQARARGEAFDRARDLGLSAGESNNLEGLGYLGR